MKWLLLSLLCMLGFSMPAAFGQSTQPYKVIPEPAIVKTSEERCVTPNILKETINSALAPEAYKLVILPQGMELEAGGPAGLFYAKQTLNQIKTQYRQEQIPCGLIEDQPRFRWRSIMLDPARYFIPADDLKQFIDVMAFYKFNKLHLHLTDNQGWRLPVPGYPKLKSVASKRKESFGNKTPHEGMYTKAELKALVKYAADRHIEIIPEVDVPGHNQALCAAYPEFLCFPDPKLEVRTIAGRTHTLVCPGKPEVWKFYNAVFKELKDIFPSKYIHLGGDEAPDDKWLACSKCAAFRARAGISDANNKSAGSQQKIAFFTQLSQILNKQGKKVIFWYDPIGPYPDGSMVTTWQSGHTAKTVTAESGDKVQVICALHQKCYFDYPQLPGDWPKNEPDTAWMPLNTLENVYSFDPGEGLTPKELEQVKGVECCLWAERLPNMERIFYQTYPRALAISEAGWSPPEVRNLENFKEKVNFHQKLIQEKWGLNPERPEKK